MLTEETASSDKTQTSHSTALLPTASRVQLALLRGPNFKSWNNDEILQMKNNDCSQNNQAVLLVNFWMPRHSPDEKIKQINPFPGS